MHSALNRDNAALLIIDLQEKLFPHVDHPCEVLTQALKIINGCKLLNVPIVVSEQNPKGLGQTIEPVRSVLGESQAYFSKTTFSCMKDESLLSHVQNIGAKQWLILGLEAHVCVLQTARDLMRRDLEVAVLNDAISSRSIYDFSTAIAEMRDFGARITSVETALFELLGDSKAPEFKQVSALIKS